jgi:hypothetical protein
VRLTADKVVTWTDPSAPAGVTTEKVYLGPDPHGLGGFQVAVATAVAAPSRQGLRDLFTARTGKTQVQLVVAVVHDGSVHLFGPDPQAQPIALPLEQAQRQLQSVLAEPDLLAATERFAGFRKANDSTGVAGFTNSGLFASHHITSNVPKRSDWDDLGNKAGGLLSKRGKQLVEALGFGTQPGPNGTMLLSIGGHPPRAIAVLLDDTEHFDAKTQRFQLSPVAFGLAVASKQEVPWLVVLRKDQIRLYPGRDGIGVGSKGQAETFFEVDLSTIDSEYAALLPLVFSAEALKADGTADELLRDSSRYASELGARLRERIYDEIVPPVAVEVAQRLAKHAAVPLDADGLSLAYRVTLRILFRLLFQAYAEDRGLLPSGRNEGFDANSLKTNARRLIDSESDEFGDSTTIWFDLIQVWNAIDHGNPQWQIPSYNGGLFSTDPDRSPEGALIKKIELPDSVLGPALKSLLIDVSSDGVLGPVDFRSLSVREFGTIYEGLLESSLSLAEEDLTIDNSGAWIPAKPGDKVYASAASVYFHTASGERKATGSYFTPKVVVDHLVERSIVPALTAHLEKVAAHLNKGDASAAAREFFDFRVADLAMGSGHFLVAAVDKIEALMRTFLTEHAVPGVTEELLRLAAVARAALGTDDVAKSEVDEVGLLRRQVARRCIYGLDINPMAVELARLALWIHTFVPGLPMSNLDHGLVAANSLAGIGTVDEALDALQPGRATGVATFFDDVIIDNLASAKTLLMDVANASEANKAEVEEGARLLARAREAADTARRIFDAAVAVRAGEIHAGAILDRDSLLRVIDLPEVSEAAMRLRPAHMPFLFPEVFLRDNPGFDVLLGNPPWEKLQIEEHSFYSLAFPGLRGLSQQDAEAQLELIRRDRPDLVREYEAATTSTQLIQKVLAKGPYPGLTAGRPDLYKAFAWRMWHLVRTDGRVGVVLPRKALEASGMKEWRLAVLEEGTVTDATVLVNTGGWVFNGIHHQIMVAVVSLLADRTAAEKTVSVRGPFESEKSFLDGVARAPMPIGVRDLLEWSPTGALPLFPDPTSLEVFLTIRSSPRLDRDDESLSVRGLREWNATDDKHRFVFTDHPGQMIPVYKGDSFDLWTPRTGSTYAYADPDRMERDLQERRLNQVRTRRSAFYAMPTAWVSNPATLPMHHPRIAWRDTTNRANARTIITALVPPEIVMVHQAYYLFFRRGTPRHQAFVLGVWSSIPFDWFARQLVERHATVEFMLGAPVPRAVDVQRSLGDRVIEISGRLAAVDDSFAEWAQGVGVAIGSVTSASQREDLTSELDAVVSLLYGLSEDQVEHIFATFRGGWAYESRLDSVLKHYREWKGKA